MIENIRYEKSASLLREYFPELIAQLEALDSEWLPEQPGPYIYFEDVLSPFLEEALMSPESEPRNGLITRGFDFVELLLKVGDAETQNLAYVAVLEGREGSWYSAALPFLGLASIKQLDEFQPDWREHARNA